jgi:SAM-dependent methyltransferase
VSISLNKVCNLEDFSDPTLRGVIGEVFAHDAARFPGFPSGREHRKQWEVALAVHTLREAGVLHEQSQVLGVGAGAEPTQFWLSNHVGRVFATDLYGDPGRWGPDADGSMLVDPTGRWPGPWRPRRLVVQHMDARELRYDDGTFDAIFSSGSIEHFGTLDDIARACAEAFRVLRPGGVLAIATEFLIVGEPLRYPSAVMFTEELLWEVLIGDHNWKPLTELDLAVSAATRATELDVPTEVEPEYERHIRRHNGRIVFHELELSRYPHVVLRVGENLFTSVPRPEKGDAGVAIAVGIAGTPRKGKRAACGGTPSPATLGFPARDRGRGLPLGLRAPVGGARRCTCAAGGIRAGRGGMPAAA